MPVRVRVFEKLLVPLHLQDEAGVRLEFGNAREYDPHVHTDCTMAKVEQKSSFILMCFLSPATQVYFLIFHILFQ